MLAVAIATVGLVAACGGGGNDDERLAAVVQQILTIGQGPDTDFDMAIGKPVDSFPSDFPVYKGDILASFRSQQEDTSSYVLVLTTDDSTEDVVNYYEDALAGNGKWEINGASISEDSGVIQFADLNNPNLGGTVVASVLQDNKDKTNVAISVSMSATTRVDAPQFELGKSLDLPKGLPSSLPPYPGSTVVGTIWVKSSDTSTTYYVRMLTTDFEEKVMDFYRQQLNNGGWRIDDDYQDETGFGLVFADSLNSEQGGAVTANALADDAKYTEVILQVDSANTTSR